MKIFIDDLRDPPDITWYVARTYKRALELITKHWDIITIISFDHDLGEEKNGNDIAKFIEHCVGFGRFPSRINLPEFIIHSWNPTGAENIRKTLESTKRIWEARKCQ